MNCLIIPCYIRTDWDLACLHRLLDSIDAQSLKLERVYVVDDASPLKYDLKDRNVDHVILEKNGGPARARNVAITKALAAGYRHLLFTDNDCILDKEWAERMTTFLDGSDFAAVEHVVAQADHSNIRLGFDVVDNTLVNALIATTGKNNVLCFG